MSTALAMVLAAAMLAGVGAPAPDGGRAPRGQVILPGSRWVEADDGSVWEFGERGELQITNTDGKKDLPSRYVVKPRANPPQIDIITVDGTALGIYRLKGDRLEICFAYPGLERPTKFAGGDEDGAPALLTFKRAK